MFRKQGNLVIVLNIWLATTGFLNAQNLVPNASFEGLRKPVCEFLTFPFTDSTSQNIGDYVQDWYSPTGGTPDPWFYNDTLTIGPPPTYECTQNLKRFKVPAQEGRRCIGINSSAPNANSSLTNAYREYVQTRLLRPLRKGAIYNVEFFIRRTPDAGTATNNIGALFSVEPVKRVERNARNYGNMIRRSPQIEETQIISSSSEWVRVQGCFRADSAYQYITLGNFRDDLNTKSLIFPNYGYQTPLCYYLIDNVSVIESKASETPPTIALGADTTLCPRTKLAIRLPSQVDIRYRWQDGDTTTLYVINRAGKYWVTADAGGCTRGDTLNVVYERTPYLPADTIVCSGVPFWLNPNTGSGLLIWSDGSSRDSLLVRQTGQYWVKVTNSVCSLSDTVNVTVFDCPSEIPNVFTPNGDGKNDTFYIDNIQVVPWRLQVYNRWGKLVHDVEAYQNDWIGEGQPTGLYYYYLSSQLLKRSMKGWVQLLR